MRLNKLFNASSSLTEEQINDFKQHFELFYKSIEIEDLTLSILADWGDDKDQELIGIDYNSLPKFSPLINHSQSDFFLENVANTKILLLSEEDYRLVEQNYLFKNRWKESDFNPDINPKLEILGCYTEEPFPQILICPERIRKYSTEESFYDLLLLVLLHELAHADLAVKN